MNEDGVVASDAQVPKRVRYLGSRDQHVLASPMSPP